MSFDLDQDTDNAVVRFKATWTRVVAVRPMQRDIRVELDEERANLRVFLLAKPAAKLPRNVQLFVTYTGEPPSPQEARSLKDGSVRGVLGEFNVLAMDSAFWQRLQEATPEAKALLTESPIKDEYDQCDEAIKNFTAELREGAKFFSDLDRATYWPLLLEQGEKEKAKAVRTLGDYLQLRTLRRATYARYGLRFQGLRHDHKWAADCKPVEKLMHDLMPTNGNNLHLGKLSTWFRNFLNGGLKVPIGNSDNIHGMPNTVNFFSFTEVIYLFRELELNWAFWRPALPLFLTASEVFTHLYWSGTERMMKSYGPSHQPENGAYGPARWLALRTVNERRIEGLDNERADLVLEELFGDMVAHALRDQTMYSPVGGVLVGGPLVTQMTLKAILSTPIGKPYEDELPADLKALWEKFEKCVNDNSHIPEKDPEQWNADICKHLRTVIVQCTDPQDPFFIDTSDCIFSRQSPDGWTYPDGAANVLVFKAPNPNPVCAFGCQRI